VRHHHDLFLFTFLSDFCAIFVDFHAPRDTGLLCCAIRFRLTSAETLGKVEGAGNQTVCMQTI